MGNKISGLIAAAGFILAGILMYESLTTYNLVYSWIYALGSLIAIVSSNMNLQDMQMNILKERIDELEKVKKK